MTRKQLELLEERLHRERKILTERLASRRRTLATPAEREAEEGDWAMATVNQSLLARLVDRDAKLLDEIDRALLKMATGQYGLCEQSGDPIGFDRLKVRPWARYATAVKESREREERHDRDPEVLGKEA
jgi:DnaK suppressor protein